MKKHVHKFLITTAFGVVAASAASDCVPLSQAVSLEVSAEKAKVLEIVTKYVATAPECACEVVKTAIKASDADKKIVAAIVEAAITSAPAQMQVITQCAVAAAPDAASDIQAVIAKLDAKIAQEGFNPLDFPGDATSTVGPRSGTGGGGSRLSPGRSFTNPPVTAPPGGGSYQQPSTN